MSKLIGGVIGVHANVAPLVGEQPGDRDAERNPLGEEIREDLLARFGLFGIRLAVQLIAAGETRSATELSSALLERSGIRGLQRASWPKRSVTGQRC